MADGEELVALSTVFASGTDGVHGVGGAWR